VIPESLEGQPHVKIFAQATLEIISIAMLREILEMGALFHPFEEFERPREKRP